jgi:hypothetical protein
MNTKTKSRGSNGEITIATAILIGIIGSFVGGVAVLYWQKYVISGQDALEAKCLEAYETDKKLAEGLPLVTDQFKASQVQAALGRYNCCKKNLTVGYTWDFTVSACLPNKSGS